MKSIRQSKKSTELSSYIIWEIKYRIGLYRNLLLKFNQEKALVYFQNTELDFSPQPNLIIESNGIQWHHMYQNINGDIYGSLNHDLHTLYIYRNGTLEKIHSFPIKILAIYVANSLSIFVSIPGALYRSVPGSNSFTEVLRYTSVDSYFRQIQGFCENPEGTLFLGEYVNSFDTQWHCGAYLYVSYDDGKTWIQNDFLVKAKINKHIHFVQWSPLLKGLILTDGDNKKKLWFNASKNYNKTSRDASIGWKDITRIHIRKGGYTAMYENEKEIFFGSDYMGGTNFIICTSNLKTFKKEVIPDPYRRGLFQNMVQIFDGKQNSIWANIHSEFSPKTRSLLMMSLDNGATWNKIIEYDGTYYNLALLNHQGCNLDKIYLMIKNNITGKLNTITVSL